MDCKTALELLDCVPQGSHQADPDVQEAAAHLRQCAACERVNRQRQADDARLEQALVRVPVPDGLLDRLLESVGTTESESARAQATPISASPLPASPDRRRLRLRSILAGVLTLGLLVAALWWNVSRPAAGPIPFADARQRLEQLFARDAKVWQTLPSWNGATSRVSLQPVDAEVRLLKPLDDPREVDLGGAPGAEAVAYQFSLGRVSGVIVVLPGAFTIPTQETLPGSSSQRAFAWRSADGSQSYVCFVHRGEPGELLRQMRRLA